MDNSKIDQLIKIVNRVQDAQVLIDAIGDAQLWAQMGDHAADGMVPAAEVKTAFTALAIAILAALPLEEQFRQRHLSAGEDAQVTVQREDPLVG